VLSYCDEAEGTKAEEANGAGRFIGVALWRCGFRQAALSQPGLQQNGRMRYLVHVNGN
jgi:hypothetical protein